MDCYMYQAALYCAPCGEKIREDLDAAGKRPEDPDAESTYDSDAYPKGPYGDGGGESDSPQHCYACNAFLENPLTSEGEEYIANEIADAIAQVLHGTREPIEPDSTLGQWIDHYEIQVTVKAGYDAESQLRARDLLKIK